ncbi:MAG: hypothetical protein ACK5NG_10605 [Chthoniobacterales bacterium]
MNFLIKNGRLFDGSGTPPQQADVRVRGVKRKVSRRLVPKVTIKDGKKHPGFDALG